VGIGSLDGRVEILELADRPWLARDEVLVEVKVAGVAHWEELVLTGRWHVGGGVTGFAPGDDAWLTLCHFATKALGQDVSSRRPASSP